MDREIWMFRPGRHAAQRLTVFILAAFVLIAGLAAAPAISAQDAEPVKLGIAPVNADGDYFDLTLEPGETRELNVQLTNHGSAAITAKTYPADVYTIVNGGFGARLVDEPTSGTTHWINYQPETLDLASEETVTRTFTLSVPEDAEPGQYITSLVIQNAEPTGGNTGDGININQINRQAIAVAVTIPGPDAPALQIGQASHALVATTSVISIEVMNTGNVHLVPYGEFTLTDPEGVEVARMPITMAIVYAGTGTLAEAPMPALLEAGEYTATLTLQEDKYGARAESGPLLISVPVLEAPQQIPVQDPAAVTDPAAEPVIETQIAGIPTWALLVAIPAAIILGALIALGVVLGLRRRSSSASVVAPQPAAPMQQQVVTRENPPAERQQTTVRRMTPPSRKTDSSRQSDFD